MHQPSLLMMPMIQMTSILQKAVSRKMPWPMMRKGFMTCAWVIACYRFQKHGQVYIYNIYCSICIACIKIYIYISCICVYTCSRMFLPKKLLENWKPQRLHQCSARRALRTLKVPWCELITKLTEENALFQVQQFALQEINNSHYIAFHNSRDPLSSGLAALVGCASTSTPLAKPAPSRSPSLVVTPKPAKCF